MCACRRAVLLFVLLFAVSDARAQSPSQETSASPGSITGQVKLGDKPTRGVILLLLRQNDGNEDLLSRIYKQKSPTKTTTDADGVYHFMNLQPGKYEVVPYTPALTSASESKVWSEREVKVGAGETVENIDFALMQGGVITGQATDAKGRPAIGQMVMIEPVEGDTVARKRADDMAFYFYFMSINRTDDRGIYRLYGLPPGRYLVSLQAVQDAGSNPFTMNYARFDYPQTFYPGVKDKAKAMAVEVKAGSETRGIDIRLGPPTSLYTASGRIIDADTGKPVPSLTASCEMTSGDSYFYVRGGMASGTNANGEFKLDSLSSGKYKAIAIVDQDSNYYSETSPFEITNGNVSGILIKVHRGQTLSGVVAIEGPTNTDPQAIITQLSIKAAISGSQSVAYQVLSVKPAADGSFRLIGVHPGSMNFSLNYLLAKTPYTLLRVEHNGIRIERNLEIPPGENLTGVRLVIAEASGVIRGQVKMADDSPLPKEHFIIILNRLADTDSHSQPGEGVDESGLFEARGLLPGEYELTVYVTDSSPEVFARARAKSPDFLIVARQRVTVTLDKEINITLVISNYR